MLWIGRMLAILARALGLAAALGLAGLVPVAAAGAAQAPTVLVAHVDGPVTPVTESYVADALTETRRGGHAALLVEMDTPGGALEPTRHVIQDFLAADVPVVVYVTPSGGRAASAGALITFAAHVAAMAPGTTIGAATPIEGDTGEAANEKVLNDTAALARNVAAARGRDVEFAEATVLQAESATADEALELGAIDLVAADQAALLDELDGTEVTLDGGERATLATAGARPVAYDLGFLRELQQLLANPNLAFLFMSIGTLAVIYELASPGMGFGGITGVILLILGFFALSVLPVNVAGLALLVLAAALFAGEVFTPGVGVLATGGAVALLLSGLFLFDGSAGVNPAVLWPTALVTGGAVVLAGRLAWRARSAPSTSGQEGLVGREVTVRSTTPAGASVVLDGTWWTVRTGGGEPLAAGQTVQVVAVDGLTLVVEPLVPLEGVPPFTPIQPVEDLAQPVSRPRTPGSPEPERPTEDNDA